jgi:hypothetical protein
MVSSLGVVGRTPYNLNDHDDHDHDDTLHDDHDDDHYTGVESLGAIREHEIAEPILACDDPHHPPPAVSRTGRYAPASREGGIHPDAPPPFHLPPQLPPTPTTPTTGSMPGTGGVGIKGGCNAP